ncbi:MAG: S8 family serine peptidase [Saprospiraceae bacterium]
MFDNIYPISYLISLGALTFWFYFHEDELKSNLLRKLFYVGFLLFGVSLLLCEGEWNYKFLMFGREMLIMVVVPVFLSFFRKNKIAFIALLFATVGGLDHFYFDALKTTYPQAQTVNSEVKVDEQGELLIEILEGHFINEIQSLLDKYGLKATPAFSPEDKNATDLDDYYLVDVPTAQERNLSAIKEVLQKNGIIEWVEMNEQYELSPIESEPQKILPEINKKYGLNDPDLENLWGFEKMNVSDLYDVLKNVSPKKQALIAILDTGVDADHEDLKGNFSSIQVKYDNDPNGHGTHCAGISAAVSNNNKGIASFSQNNDFVRVTSVKVLMGGGSGTQKMIIDGILEAADAGADVLSLSLGGLSNDSRQRAYKKAVEYANKKGAIVLAAAGNSKQNAKNFTPANTPGIICVAAVDNLNNRAFFSNFVQDVEMGIAAPGVNIYSTWPGSEYQSLSGTSMATPYVAGLIGLMKSIQPDIKTKEVYRILNKTGLQTNDGDETGRLIQPGAAIQELLKNQ